MFPSYSLHGMRPVLLLAFIFILSGFISPASATTRAVVDIGAILEIRKAFTEYQKLHDGVPPKNWTELETVLDPKVRIHRTNQTKRYSIDERYEFVDQTVPMPGEPASRVLFIRKIPLHSGTRLYRPLLYLTETGETEFRLCPEHIVLSIFKGAGVQLPRADNLPKSEPAFPFVLESGDLLCLMLLTIILLIVVENLLKWRKKAKARKATPMDNPNLPLNAGPMP